MRFGTKSPIEPRSVQFEKRDQKLEVMQLPGRRPTFILEHEGRGNSNRVVIDPSQIMKEGRFRPDAQKLRKFYDRVDDEVLEEAREQLRNQDPPSDEKERESYYAALALLHTPTEESELNEVRQKMNGGRAA